MQQQRLLFYDSFLLLFISFHLSGPKASVRWISFNVSMSLHDITSQLIVLKMKRGLIFTTFCLTQVLPESCHCQNADKILNYFAFSDMMALWYKNVSPHNFLVGKTTTIRAGMLGQLEKLVKNPFYFRILSQRSTEIVL